MSVFATFSGFPERETITSNVRGWFAPAKDKPTKLREEYADWLSAELALIETANKRIYTNGDVTSLDLRFHLGAVSSAVADGQRLILEALMLRDQGTVAEDFFEAEIAALDEHIAQLVSRINEWHGTIDSQADLPNSLKQAFREATAGEVIPFPQD